MMVSTEEIQTLTNLRCSPCHVSANGSTAGGIPPALNDMANIAGTTAAAGQSMVTAGDRGASHLFTRVSAEVGQMPPGQRMPESEIEKFGAWIDGLQ